ncbi:MAG TPA: dihydrodipicolinate synthase family protein [Pyrinomonadaceae bacterium]
MKPQDKTNQPDATGARLLAEKLRGILLPFPTPFSADGEIDGEALCRNLARWNETGVRGYVALGSTGERVHLDEREYLQVVETARESVGAEMVLLAGAGQQSTRGSIEEVRRAARAGADGVLVITPGFYRGAMTQAALTKHYESVADASVVPLVLYNIPQNTGIALAPETVARLAEHENITGIKDSSGDMVNMTEMLRLVPEGFAALTGHGALLHASLLSGARGGILAVACAAPRLSVAIYEAVEAGAYARALEMQRRLAPLAKAVTTRFGIGGLKAALDLCGYEGGHVRAPLEAVSEEAQRELARLVEESALAPGEEVFLSRTAGGART